MLKWRLNERMKNIASLIKTTIKSRSTLGFCEHMQTRCISDFKKISLPFPTSACINGWLPLYLIRLHVICSLLRYSLYYTHTNFRIYPIRFHRNMQSGSTSHSLSHSCSISNWCYQPFNDYSNNTSLLIFVSLWSFKYVKYFPFFL